MAKHRRKEMPNPNRKKYRSDRYDFRQAYINDLPEIRTSWHGRAIHGHAYDPYSYDPESKMGTSGYYNKFVGKDGKVYYHTPSGSMYREDDAGSGNFNYAGYRRPSDKYTGGSVNSGKGVNFNLNPSDKATALLMSLGAFFGPVGTFGGYVLGNIYNVFSGLFDKTDEFGLTPEQRASNDKAVAKMREKRLRREAAERFRNSMEWHQFVQDFIENNPEEPDSEYKTENDSEYQGENIYPGQSPYVRMYYKAENLRRSIKIMKKDFNNLSDEDKQEYRSTMYRYEDAYEEEWFSYIEKNGRLEWVDYGQEYVHKDTGKPFTKREKEEFFRRRAIQNKEDLLRLIEDVMHKMEHPEEDKSENESNSEPSSESSENGQKEEPGADSREEPDGEPRQEPPKEESKETPKQEHTVSPNEPHTRTPTVPYTLPPYTMPPTVDPTIPPTISYHRPPTIPPRSPSVARSVNKDTAKTDTRGWWERLWGKKQDKPPTDDTGKKGNTETGGAAGGTGTGQGGVPGGTGATGQAENPLHTGRKILENAVNEGRRLNADEVQRLSDLWNELTPEQQEFAKEYWDESKLRAEWNKNVKNAGSQEAERRGGPRVNIDPNSNPQFVDTGVGGRYLNVPLEIIYGFPRGVDATLNTDVGVGGKGGIHILGADQDANFGVSKDFGGPAKAFINKTPLTDKQIAACVDEAIAKMFEYIDTSKMTPEEIAQLKSKAEEWKENAKKGIFETSSKSWSAFLKALQFLLQSAVSFQESERLRREGEEEKVRDEGEPVFDDKDGGGRDPRFHPHENSDDDSSEDEEEIPQQPYIPDDEDELEKDASVLARELNLGSDGKVDLNEYKRRMFNYIIQYLLPKTANNVYNDWGKFIAGVPGYHENEIDRYLAEIGSKIREEF